MKESNARIRSGGALCDSPNKDALIAGIPFRKHTRTLYIEHIKMAIQY
jgi:hypothetical protein